MNFIFKIGTTEELFQSGLLFSSVSLAESLYFSYSTAVNQIRKLRAEGKLVIVDYVPPKTRGLWKPIYGWRYDEKQEDKIFVSPSNGKNTQQKLELAHEKRRRCISQERKDAMKSATTPEQKRAVNEEYVQKFAALEAENNAYHERRKKRNADYNARKSRLKKGTLVKPTSLLGCWNPSVNRSLLLQEAA